MSSIRSQIEALEAKAVEAMKMKDYAAERKIDEQIVALRKQLERSRPRANRALTEEDWKQIESEGPTAGYAAWGGYWEVRKSDKGPQRYKLDCSWAMSFRDAIARFMRGGPWPNWIALIWRYEDLRGRTPGPYMFFNEFRKHKHWYICGVVDGSDGQFFRFPRLIDLFNAKDYALELLRKEGRLDQSAAVKSEEAQSYFSEDGHT
jgi:hypothetical protein